MPRAILIPLIIVLCGCSSGSPGLRKSEWTLALFRNDTDKNVTLCVQGKHSTGGFVAFAHKVREEEIDAYDHEILVFPDIGPESPPPGTRVVASCKIDFRKLSQGHQYLPPASPKRHLYFRITRGRIEQVSSLEGHTWKIDLLFRGPDYDGAITGITRGSNQAMELTASRTAFTFHMTRLLSPPLALGSVSRSSSYSR